MSAITTRSTHAVRHFFESRQVLLVLGPQWWPQQTLPSLESMVLQHAKTLLDRASTSDQGLLRSWIEAGEWLRLGKFIRDRDLDSFVQRLQQAVDDFQGSPPYYLQLLSRFNVPFLATFEWDPRLFSLLGEDYGAYHWRNCPTPVSMTGSERLFLHLHGTVGDPASLVFDLVSDTQLREEQGARVRALLAHINEQHHMVALGFAADDPRLTWLAEACGQKGAGQTLMRVRQPEQLPQGMAWMALPEPGSMGGGNLPPEAPLNQWFKTSADALRLPLPAYKPPETQEAQVPGFWRVRVLDANYFEGLEPPDKKQIQSYFRGQKPTWALIKAQVHVVRDELSQFDKWFKDSRRPMALLRAAAGEGKTTLAMDLVYRYVKRGFKVVEVHGDRVLPSDVLGQLPQEPVFILVHRADQLISLKTLLQAVAQRSQTSLLLLARSLDWRHGQRPPESFSPPLHTFGLKPLGAQSVQVLATKIQAVGFGEGKDPEELAHQFEQDAKDSLLAAIWKATRGDSLQNIIESLVNGIGQWYDGSLLLRALGLVAAVEHYTDMKCSNKLFQHFLDLRPTQVEGLLGRLQDELSLSQFGNQSLRTRHPLIAQMVCQALFQPQQVDAAFNELNFLKEVLWAAAALDPSKRGANEGLLLTQIPKWFNQKGRSEDEIQLLRVAAQLAPQNPAVWQMWGIAAWKSGFVGSLEEPEPESARKLFRQALDVELQHAPTYQAWALMEAEQGNRGSFEQPQPFSARDLFDKALKADPNNAPSYHAWAVMERDQGNTKRALELALAGFKKAPNNYRLFHLIRTLKAFQNLRNRETKPAFKFTSKDRFNVKKSFKLERWDLPPDPMTVYQATNQELAAGTLRSTVALELLTYITPWINQPVLTGPLLAQLPQEPICLLPTQDQAESRSLFALTEAGQVFRIDLNRQQPAEPEQTPWFQIPHFNPLRERALGLYWHRPQFSQKNCLLVVGFVKGAMVAYLLDPKAKRPDPFAVSHLPPWLHECPINLAQGMRLEDYQSLKPPTLHNTVLGAYFGAIEKGEYDTFLASDLASLDPDWPETWGRHIHQIGKLVWVLRPDQTVRGYLPNTLLKENKLQRFPQWKWSHETQPVALADLGDQQGKPLAAIGFESGEIKLALCMAESQETKSQALQTLADRLVERIAATEDLNTPQAWLRWSQNLLNHYQEPWLPQQASLSGAVVRMLVAQAIDKPWDPEIFGPTVGAFIERLYHPLQALPLMAKLRQVIRCWTAPPPKAETAWLWQLYQHTDPFGQDILDLELKTHSSRLHLSSVSDPNLARLLESADASAGLQYEQSQLAENPAALYAEKRIDRYSMAYHHRPTKVVNGVLRRLPDGKTVWLLRDQVLVLQGQEQPRDISSQLSSHWRGFNRYLSLAISQGPAGIVGFERHTARILRQRQGQWCDDPFPLPDLDAICDCLNLSPQIRAQLVNHPSQPCLPLTQMADASDGLVFLLYQLPFDFPISATKLAKNRCLLLLWEPLADQPRIKAYRLLPGRTPREFAVRPSQHPGSWLIAINLTPSTIATIHLKLRPDPQLDRTVPKLQFAPKGLALRRVHSRVRAMTWAKAHNGGHLLVGNTDGNIFAFTFEGSQHLDPVWVVPANGAIRHLDVLPAGDGYRVLALSGHGDAMVCDHHGHLLWRTPLRLTFRSGCLYRHKDRNFMAVSDIRGALAVYAEHPPSECEARLKASIKVDADRPEARAFVHGFQQPDFDQDTLAWFHNNRHYLARALFIRGFSAQLYQDPFQHQKFARDLMPLLSFDEMRYLAEPHYKGNPQLLMPTATAWMQHLGQMLPNKRPAKRLRRGWIHHTLTTFLRGMGRGWILAQWITPLGGTPWYALPPWLRNHGSITITLFHTHMTHDPLQDDAQRLAELLRLATLIGPAAFEVLPWLVPHRAQSLAHHLETLFDPHWFQAQPKTSSEDEQAKPHPLKAPETYPLTLDGPSRTLLDMFHLLAHPDVPWSHVAQVARKVEHHHQALAKLSPALGHLCLALRPYAAKYAAPHESMARQWAALDDLQNIKIPNPPSQLGPWTNWVNWARGRLSACLHQAIAQERNRLQTMVRVRPAQMVLIQLDQGRLILKIRLEKEGQPPGPAEVSLQFERGAFKPETEQRELTWFWDQLPEDLEIKGRYAPQSQADQDWGFTLQSWGQGIASHRQFWESRNIMRRDDKSQSHPIWREVPHLATYFAEDLAQCTKAVPEQQDPLPALVFLSYDPQLGFDNFLQVLVDQHHFEQLQLDHLLPQWQDGIPQQFSGRALALALGFERRAQLAQNSPNEAPCGLVYPAEVTAQRLLDPKHRATLKAFAEKLAHYRGKPICWLLPCPKAFALHSHFASLLSEEKVWLYNLDRLPVAGEHGAAGAFRKLLKQRYGSGAQEIWRLCGGNLGFYSRFISSGKIDWGEPQLAHYLKDQLQGLNPVDVLNLVVLAHSTLAEGLGPSDLAQDLAKHFKVDDTTFTGQMLDRDLHQVPEHLTAFKQVGEKRDYQRRTDCRRLVAKRGLLELRADWCGLKQPLRQWIQTQSATLAQAQSLTQQLMGQALLDALNINDLAVMGEALQTLFPQSCPSGHNLLQHLQTWVENKADKTTFKATAALLCKHPVTCFAEADASAQEMQWRQALYPLIPKGRCYKVQGPDQLLWLAFLDQVEPAWLQSLQKHWGDHAMGDLKLALLYHRKSVGQPELASLTLLGPPQLKQIALSPDPAHSFHLMVRNSAGLAHLSPFRAGGALDNDALSFVGREAELQQILQGIHQESFLILGGRQIGKTSLLHKLQSRMQALGRTCYSVDCAGITSTPKFLEKLLWATGAQQDIPASEEDALSAVEKCLLTLDGAIVLMNEIDGLAWRAVPLLQRLRHLSEVGRCQFVMTGYHGAYGGLQNNDHPLFHWTQGVSPGEKAIFLGAIDPNAAQRLIDLLEDSQLKLQWESPWVKDEISQLLLQRTHCIPLLLQRVCKDLVTHLDHQRRYIIRERDFQREEVDRYPAWTYLEGIRITLDPTQHMKMDADRAYTSTPPEEHHWGKLVLALAAKNLYFQAQDPLIKRPELATLAATRVGFSTAQAVTFLEDWLIHGGHWQARSLIQNHFNFDHYSQMLNLMTLTVMLSPDPSGGDQYSFFNHIYPLELAGYLKRQDMTMEAYCRRELDALLTALRHQRRSQ